MSHLFPLYGDIDGVAPALNLGDFLLMCSNTLKCFPNDIQIAFFQPNILGEQGTDLVDMVL